MIESWLGLGRAGVWRLPAWLVMVAAIVVVLAAAGGTAYRHSCVGLSGTRKVSWTVGWPYVSADAGVRCHDHTVLRYVAGKAGLDDDLDGEERYIYSYDIVQTIGGGSDLAADVVHALQLGASSQDSFFAQDRLTMAAVVRGRLAYVTAGDIDLARTAIDAARKRLAHAIADLRFLGPKLAAHVLPPGRYVRYSPQTQGMLAPWNDVVNSGAQGALQAAHGFARDIAVYAHLDRCLGEAQRLVSAGRMNAYPSACLVAHPAARPLAPDETSNAVERDLAGAIDYFLASARQAPDSRLTLSLVEITHPGGLLWAKPRRVAPTPPAPSRAPWQ